MPGKKRSTIDVVYLESGESSEDYLTDYEVIKLKDGSPCIKKRKIYRVRYRRVEPRWLKEMEEKEKEEDQANGNNE